VFQKVYVTIPAARGKIAHLSTITTVLATSTYVIRGSELSRNACRESPARFTKQRRTPSGGFSDSQKNAHRAKREDDEPGYCRPLQFFFADAEMADIVRQS
jgi:hypothetical protein